MRGTIKKFDPRGFGIIYGSDGLKVPFVLSDFAGRQLPRQGQKVVFSIRRVQGKLFANNIVAGREALNAA
jgi:cold shock CspA family protein